MLLFIISVMNVGRKEARPVYSLERITVNLTPFHFLPMKVKTILV